MYGTLEDATAYHVLRANAGWAQELRTDADRTAALVRASDALDALYGPRFNGCAATLEQPHEWPRAGAVYRNAALPEYVTPEPVLRAVFEMALRELEAPGSMAPDLTQGIKTAQAGSASVTFMDGQTSHTVFTLIDGLLKPFLRDEAKGGFVMAVAVRR